MYNVSYWLSFIGYALTLAVNFPFRSKKKYVVDRDSFVFIVIGYDNECLFFIAIILGIIVSETSFGRFTIKRCYLPTGGGWRGEGVVCQQEWLLSVKCCNVLQTSNSNCYAFDEDKLKWLNFSVYFFSWWAWRLPPVWCDCAEVAFEVRRVAWWSIVILLSITFTWNMFWSWYQLWCPRVSPTCRFMEVFIGTSSSFAQRTAVPKKK